MRYVFWINIFLLLALTFLQNCDGSGKMENKLHQIPSLIVNAQNLHFVYVQDTVYYKQKHFSGYQFELYANGDTAVVRSFYNGLLEGYQKKWYPNKQLAENRFYVAGKKESLHESWWPSGKLKFQYQFANDEFNGVLKEWYENGILFKEFNYKAGHEDGSIKMWWINGKTKANYVIKNGRRYGLLGTKNCINVADSVSFKR